MPVTDCTTLKQASGQGLAETAEMVEVLQNEIQLNITNHLQYSTVHVPTHAQAQALPMHHLHYSAFSKWYCGTRACKRSLLSPTYLVPLPYTIYRLAWCSLYGTPQQLQPVRSCESNIHITFAN